MRQSERGTARVRSSGGISALCRRIQPVKGPKDPETQLECRRQTFHYGGTTALHHYSVCLRSTLHGLARGTLHCSSLPYTTTTWYSMLTYVARCTTTLRYPTTPTASPPETWSPGTPLPVLPRDSSTVDPVASTAPSSLPPPYDNAVRQPHLSSARLAPPCTLLCILHRYAHVHPLMRPGRFSSTT